MSIEFSLENFVFVVPSGFMCLPLCVLLVKVLAENWF